MSLPFLTFLDQNEIEQVTAFLALLEVHALCLDHLYCYICKIFSSLPSLVQLNLTPAWPQYDVRTKKHTLLQARLFSIYRKITSICIECLAK
jgi:hypothetical protein